MNDQNIPFEVTRARRAGARLAAVQALYEMEQTGKSARATLLRAGSAEFIAHQHLSNAIILDEYVSLAHDFFDEQEAKFANAVLDNLAKDLRK